MQLCAFFKRDFPFITHITSMRIKWLLLISILLAAYTSHGQIRRVVGQVTDATDEKPLVQLSVLLKGATVGVVTDADGRYSIEVPGSDAVLQFLYMGMESQEVEVGERNEINIAMHPSTEAIEQVVVMGYGSGKKVSSTVGRVSSVAGKVVQARPSASALDGLASRVPGLSVLNYTGEPSEAGSIRLHGAGSLGASSAPLIVVDGLPVSTETLLSINPQDFERVDILTRCLGHLYLRVSRRQRCYLRNHQAGAGGGEGERNGTLLLWALQPGQHALL